jgi:hypothetical protein
MLILIHEIRTLAAMTVGTAVGHHHYYQLRHPQQQQMRYHC